MFSSSYICVEVWDDGLLKIHTSSLCLSLHFFTARCYYTERGCHGKSSVRLWRWGIMVTHVGILRN